MFYLYFVLWDRPRKTNTTWMTNRGNHDIQKQLTKYGQSNKDKHNKWDRKTRAGKRRTRQTDQAYIEIRQTLVCLLVGCLTSQQHASVSQGRICSDKFTCCHTEIEAADQAFHLTQSQYTDTGRTSPSADPITPGAWQGSHWSVNF